MAAYADLTFYKDNFFGEELTEQNAGKWLSLASDEIDTITFGRLTFAFPTVEAHAERVRKAVCAIAEALYHIDLQRKAVTAHRAADGTYRGAIASISSGRESISFSVGNASASTYAAAAASTVEQNKLLSSIAAKYLANIPDANGINLLYAGSSVYKHSSFPATGGGATLPTVNIYDGDYVVTPTADGLALPTTDKYLTDDVEINPIPYYEFDNSAGGRTVYIGKENING